MHIVEKFKLHSCYQLNMSSRRHVVPFPSTWHIFVLFLITIDSTYQDKMFHWFSQICLFFHQTVIPVPDKLSLTEAAAAVVNYGTAMLAIKRKAKLQKKWALSYSNIENHQIFQPLKPILSWPRLLPLRVKKKKKLTN